MTRRETGPRCWGMGKTTTALPNISERNKQLSFKTGRENSPTASPPPFRLLRPLMEFAPFLPHLYALTKTTRTL